MNRLALLAAGFLAPVLAVLTGCGSPAEKTVVVKGKLMRGGVPFTTKEANGGKPLPPGDPGIRVKFTLVGSQGEEDYDIAVDGNNGTFEAIGKAGKGIPPGHYKVAVFGGAFTLEAGKADVPGGPPKGGAPKGGAPSIGGSSGARPIHTQEVDVPDAGLTDLVIDIKGK